MNVSHPLLAAGAARGSKAHATQCARGDPASCGVAGAQAVTYPTGAVVWRLTAAAVPAVAAWRQQRGSDARRHHGTAIAYATANAWSAAWTGKVVPCDAVPASLRRPPSAAPSDASSSSSSVDADGPSDGVETALLWSDALVNSAAVPAWLAATNVFGTDSLAAARRRGSGALVAPSYVGTATGVDAFAATTTAPTAGPATQAPVGTTATPAPSPLPTPIPAVATPPPPTTTTPVGEPPNTTAAPADDDASTAPTGAPLPSFVGDDGAGGGGASAATGITLLVLLSVLAATLAGVGFARHRRVWCFSGEHDTQPGDKDAAGRSDDKGAMARRLSRAADKRKRHAAKHASRTDAGRSGRTATATSDGPVLEAPMLAASGGAGPSATTASMPHQTHGSRRAPSGGVGPSDARRPNNPL